MTTQTTATPETPVMDEAEKKVIETLEKLLKIKGLKVEVLGLWIWVSGDTKPVKEELKELGLKWAHHKKMWYFAGVRSTGRSGGKAIGYIRGKYGNGMQAIET